MSHTKKTVLSLITIAAAVVAVFFLAKYGWKLGGFRYCAPPDVLAVRSVAVDEEAGNITLTGNIADAFSSFVGSTTKLEGENLYIGLKYNLFLGFIKRSGSFHVQVACETSAINKIYFKNGTQEQLVWDKNHPVL